MYDGGGAVTLQGSNRMGGLANLAENLHAAPFSKGLSKEAAFSYIYLAGQYL